MDSEAQKQQRVHDVLRRALFLQALVAFPTMCLLGLAIFLELVIPDAEQKYFFYIFLYFVMAAAIIVIVLIQFKEKEQSAVATLKCEATKTTLATLLWLTGWIRAIWRILAESGSGDDNDEQHKRRRSALSFLWPSIWTILIIMLFYPALYYAYKQWRNEQRPQIYISNFEDGEDEEEHMIRMISTENLAFVPDGEALK
ncbi:hypothetical protein BDV96DRAFT_641009 [Lophiotrema nucula]|uniref:Transmembrane protein n=1 Tax=Lophiotrema nucula TaxID=690887 RepID=A0A6A5ZRM3_9PLEO|nr:hypothetical protein BDV96DRAFT_641009 [Lophiotrema nucula]